MAERRNIPSFSGSRTSTTPPRLTSSMKRLTNKRYRNEMMIFMRSDEPNPQAGPLWKREDYKSSTSALMCLQQEQGDKTAQHIGPYHSTKFGVAQPELADVLLDTDCILFFIMVTKTRHGGILDTGKILNSGESGNQKNGKTKSGGRNGKQRPQTIQVHSSIRKVIADEDCFKCCPRCPEFSDFFAVLHIHQPCICF